MIAEIVELLPAPFAPKRPKHSPSKTRNDRWSTATTPSLAAAAPLPPPLAYTLRSPWTCKAASRGSAAKTVAVSRLTSSSSRAWSASSYSIKGMAVAAPRRSKKTHTAAYKTVSVNAVSTTAVRGGNHDVTARKDFFDSATCRQAVKRAPCGEKMTAPQNSSPKTASVAKWINPKPILPSDRSMIRSMPKGANNKPRAIIGTKMAAPRDPEKERP
mmetsp:Transcript_30365/g.92877  ORF Transcript_30365/g.92877 Transcript_30365/m.92877 type:complete len:215 (-) Transcript_30365:341-985(-)